MNYNEPLFDETGEMTSEEKAKEQVDSILALREYEGPTADVQGKKLSAIGNLIMLYDNEEIDDFELIDTIREIIEMKSF